MHLSRYKSFTSDVFWYFVLQGRSVNLLDIHRDISDRVDTSEQCECIRLVGFAEITSRIAKLNSYSGNQFVIARLFILASIPLQYSSAYLFTIHSVRCRGLLEGLYSALQFHLLCVAPVMLFTSWLRFWLPLQTVFQLNSAMIDRRYWRISLRTARLTTTHLSRCQSFTR